MGDTRRSQAVVNRSELVARLALAAPQLSLRDVELAVRTLLAHMTEALASGQRIELRGFGSFSRHYRAPRVGRNPRTSDPMAEEGTARIIGVRMANRRERALYHAHMEAR